jgi:hypothetical protein
MPKFTRYIGVDYTGAQTPTASLKGLRVLMTEGDRPPTEVSPPPSPRKYWTRRGIAEGWLRNWPRMFPRWSASTTAFRFCCGTLSFTISRPNGRSFSTISSSADGPQAARAQYQAPDRTIE